MAVAKGCVSSARRGGDARGRKNGSPTLLKVPLSREREKGAELRLVGTKEPLPSPPLFVTSTCDETCRQDGIRMSVLVEMPIATLEDDSGRAAISQLPPRSAAPPLDL